MKNNPIRAFLVLTVPLAVALLGWSGPPQEIYRDPGQSVQRRVDHLMSLMTLDEKMAQIQCRWLSKSMFLDEEGNFDPEKAAHVLADGIGQIGRPSEGPEGVGGRGRSPAEHARFTNQIQRFLRERTRLGVPALFHEECLHGHAARDATSFSQPIGLASTWNRDLVERLFAMTAKEARVRGTHLALTPVLDVARDPRWGRFEETYGEDPYLVGEMGLAAVYGFQGRDGQIGPDHLLATLKHLAGHGQPESGNNTAPANYSERVIREVFLAPFKRAVIEGKAAAVMASYNEVDGVPSHANRWLLRDVLRGEWGFKGMVVADYFAIAELQRRHRVAEDLQQAGVLALKAGVDIELPDPAAYPLLRELFEDGRLEPTLLDDAVRRTLAAKFALGLFDDTYVDPEEAARVVGSAENARLALEAAEQTMILLQNRDGLLPLDLARRPTIAVIGPNADRELIGGYSDVPKHVVTVLEGIRAKVGDRARVLYAEGCGITEPGSWYKDPVVRTDPEQDRRKIAEAVQIARQADVIVLAVGGNELTSREAWAETHLGDRTDLRLVGLQDELIDALAATGKPIAALLFNGRPLAVGNLKEKAHAIFECWYLGQEGGHAAANVLFGDVSPSGKLPVTIPRSVGHLPAFYNHKPTARRGYLFDDVSPLWPFGFGLSYTTFEIGAPKLERSAIAGGEKVGVTVEVANTGARAGMEVVQLYIRDQISSVTRPVKELKGFEKVSLEPGQRRTVRFEIGPESLAFYDIDMRWTVEPGMFDVMVGASSRDEDLKSVTLEVR